MPRWAGYAFGVVCVLAIIVLAFIIFGKVGG